MKPIFQHITIPVDGSTTAKRGVAFALELAREGGRLSFCSVVEPTLVCAPSVHGSALDFAPMLEALDDDAALLCRRARDEAETHGMICDTRVLHGSCVEEICSYAARNGSDAIVIGTHGRTGLLRAALGSVAQGVVRRSEIPVFCVHENDEMRSGPLAVAIDPSHAAQAALALGVAIAAARGMPLMIVHIGTHSDAAAVNTLLAQAAQYVRACGIATQLIVRNGEVAGELIAAANEEDCCMMVIGTHSRAPLARFVLGSVAAAVVEAARFPVVTVRRAA